MTGRLYAEALAYAARAHAGQNRKGTPLPYITHPVAVSALVLEHGGDEEQAAAALLHDVVEDCGAAHLAEIRNRFGPRVALIVEGCTDGVAGADGRKPPWRERKQAYLRHLDDAPDDVIFVAACDKLHNARSIVADAEAGADVFARFTAGRDGTLWYYHALAEGLSVRLRERRPLSAALDAAVERMTELAALG